MWRVHMDVNLTMSNLVGEQMMQITQEGDLNTVLTNELMSVFMTMPFPMHDPCSWDDYHEVKFE